MIQQQSKAKQISIMAVVAALYAILFYGSAPGMLPGFTVLYLPAVLLGVLPLWFGWYGLAGSMIGAFIGGVYVEAVPPYAAWVESVTALIIFSINWLLIPQNVANLKSKRNLLILIAVYALSLFIGTAYILWQYTYLFNIGILGFSLIGDFSFLFVLAATFALNFAVQIIVCPALLRTITPRLKSWGVYSGTFAEWRKRKKQANI
ncbi:MAG: hypothetical protein NWE92_08910 [Candidatus Bathyarchaeota archaeon]|nr:hypothetical protein [Candidatus Bathyarchaeota archaeon]